MELLHRSLRPDGPVAEEAADDAAFDGGAIHDEAIRREKVEEDVVVVAGVEGDVVAAGFGDCANHIDGLVAAEGGDFDRGDILDFGEASPEGVGEGTSAGAGLKIKTDEREDFGNRAAMGDEFGVGCVTQCAEAEEDGVVAEVARDGGFGGGLVGATAGARDFDEGRGGVAQFGCDEFEDGSIEAVIADGKLGGVNADGDAARAGGAIVADEGALVAFVEFAVLVESERAGGDDYAPMEEFVGCGVLG